jgi:hypothetical protein
MKGILEQFSPSERKVLERYQNAILGELRDEILDNSRLT